MEVQLTWERVSDVHMHCGWQLGCSLTKLL